MFPVADLDRAVGFYRDTLGMALLWWEREQKHAAFNTSAGPLVLRSEERENLGPEGGPILAFEVEDVPSAYEELLEKGVKFLGNIEEHGGRITARFQDPDGNLLELNQTKAPPIIS